jgi:hypothetical protein
MDPALAALIGTLVGGIISLLATANQQKRQHSHERKRLLLEKVEESYQETLSVRDAYRIAWSTLAGQLGSGRISDDKKFPKINIARVRMLVAIYLPEVEPQILALESQAATFGDVVGECVMTIDGSPAERKAMQGRLVAGFKELDTVCEALLTRLSQVAASLK